MEHAEQSYPTFFFTTRWKLKRGGSEVWRSHRSRNAAAGRPTGSFRTGEGYALYRRTSGCLRRGACSIQLRPRRWYVGGGKIPRLAICNQRLEACEPHLAQVAVRVADKVAPHSQTSSKLGEAHARAKLRNDCLSLETIYSFTPEALYFDTGQPDVLQRAAAFFFRHASASGHFRHGSTSTCAIPQRLGYPLPFRTTKIFSAKPAVRNQGYGFDSISRICSGTDLDHDSRILGILTHSKIRNRK